MADNQHYVAQAHLKQFVHPTSGQNVLYPYDKGIGALPAKGPRGLASADEFYVQVEDGEKTNKLDEQRKIVETRIFASGKGTAGTLATCIHDEGFTPDGKGAIDLAFAAAFLRYGSPVQIHNTAMIGLLSNQMHAFNTLDTDDAKKRYEEDYGDEAAKRIATDRESLLNGQLWVDVGEENWKQFGFFSYHLVEELAKGLLSMNLSVIDTHGDNFFITSDNPVIVHSTSQPDNPGHGLKDAIVWFPISFKRALLWHRRRHPPREVFSARECRIKNELMLKWCYKHIYSPLAAPWLNGAAKEEAFDACLGHYRTLGDVINQAAPALLPDGTPAGEIVDIGRALRGVQKVDALGI